MKNKKSAEEKVKASIAGNIRKSEKMLKALLKDSKKSKTTPVKGSEQTSDFYNKRWENLTGNKNKVSPVSKIV